MNIKHSIALGFALLVAGLHAASAQVAENTRLFREIMQMDSQLFDEGFNECKLDKFESNVGDDLEFFHDKGGRQNKAEFMKAVQDNVCSGKNGKPLRTLVPGSSKIYPLENNGVLYGAVQNGTHEFRTRGADEAVEGYTTAKFTNVWIMANGQWKLKTSLSFDHQHIDGKKVKKVVIRKAVAHPVKVFQLTVASLSWYLYFQDQKKNN